MQRPLLTLTAAAALAACGTDPVEPPSVPTGPRLDVAATTPTIVPAVSAGQMYATCALGSGGQIRCWGNSAHGGTTPAALPAGVVYTGVSTGGHYGCGVRSDGQVACWGSDEYGKATPAPLATGVSYTEVSANTMHTCAVRSDGGVSCWGYSREGSNQTDRLVAPALPPEVRYQQVGVGDWHACAVRSDGAIACWGDFGYGQANVPALPAGVTYTQVSGGERFSCAVRSDGQIACWGDNTAGQATPPVVEGVTYRQVSVGRQHACALRTDGQVACWGTALARESTPPAGLNLIYQAQAITFTSTPPNPALVGASYTVTGGGSGNSVTFSSLTPAVCTIACSTVDLIAVGECRVAADQAGSAAYFAAPQQTQAFTVTSPAQAITFTSTPPSPALVGGSYGVSASGGASGNAVTFSSVTPATCTVSGSSVSLVAAGACTVAADQAAGGGYASAPQQTQSFTISKAAQTITFSSTPPAPALLGGTYEVVATGGGSGNPTVFSSLTPAACGVSDGTVSFVAVGSCTVAADQSGNAAHDAAPRVTQTVAVVYAFTGFFTPVSNLPTVNVARAGSTLPLKFALGGDQGLAVLAAGSPSSQTVACQSGAATAPVEQTATAGSSSLSYDVLSGQYTYTWKTDRDWAGTCRRLTVRLVDGTTHTADFKF